MKAYTLVVALAGFNFGLMSAGLAIKNYDLVIISLITMLICIVGAVEGYREINEIEEL